MTALAAELDGQLTEVAAILRARRDQCDRMASELRTLFARMQVSVARAREAAQDPPRAKLLTDALRAYDDTSVAREAQIDRDFTAAAPCAKHRDVQDALMSMPTL